MLLFEGHAEDEGVVPVAGIRDVGDHDDSFVGGNEPLVNCLDEIAGRSAQPFGMRRSRELVRDRLLQVGGFRDVRDVQRLVSVRDRDRPPVLGSSRDDVFDLLARRDAECLGEFCRGGDLLDLAVHLDLLLGLVLEGLFGALHLAFRRDANEVRPVGDEDAPPAHGPNKPLALQEFDGLANHDVRHAVLLGDLGVAR